MLVSLATAARKVEALPRDKLVKRRKIKIILNLDRRRYVPYSKRMQHYLENRLFDLVQIPSASVILDKIVLRSGSIM